MPVVRLCPAPGRHPQSPVEGRRSRLPQASDGVGGSFLRLARSGQRFRLVDAGEQLAVYNDALSGISSVLARSSLQD